MKAALDLSGFIAKKFNLPYSFSFVAKNLNDPKDVEGMRNKGSNLYP